MIPPAAITGASRARALTSSRVRAAVPGRHVGGGHGVEHPAVSAGLVPLGDDRVRSRRRRQPFPPLRRLRCRGEEHKCARRPGSESMTPGSPAGRAEVEADDRRPFPQEDPRLHRAASATKTRVDLPSNRPRRDQPPPYPCKLEESGGRPTRTRAPPGSATRRGVAEHVHVERPGRSGGHGRREIISLGGGLRVSKPRRARWSTAAPAFERRRLPSPGWTRRPSGAWMIGWSMSRSSRSCRCYGGCPSGAELEGCGCHARNPSPEPPDGRPPECPNHAARSIADGRIAWLTAGPWPRWPRPSASTPRPCANGGTGLRAEGEAGLADRSSRPHRSPTRLRRGRRGRDRGAAPPAPVRPRHRPPARPAALHRGVVLRRLGLGRLAPSTPSPRSSATSATQPGELIHLDIKKLGRIDGVGHRITGDRARPEARHRLGVPARLPSTTPPGSPTPRSCPTSARRVPWPSSSAPSPGSPASASPSSGS